MKTEGDSSVESSKVQTHKYKDFSKLPHDLFLEFGRLTDTSEIEAALRDKRNRLEQYESDFRNQSNEYGDTWKLSIDQASRKVFTLNAELVSAANSGIINRFFNKEHRKQLLNELKDERGLLNQLVSLAEKSFPLVRIKPNGKPSKAFSGLPESLNRKIDFLEKRLAQAIRRDKKQEKIHHQKAKIAAAEGKTRSYAKSVKQMLKPNHDCPYCGGSLGSNPHADHIYPVAKGGQSLKKNMVHVCSKCNLKKRDDTLAMFIHKHRLNRDEIEHRLRLLKKEF